MTGDFLELAEIEFRLPRSALSVDRNKRRILGAAIPLAGGEDSVARSGRAFVMSLRDDPSRYVVDLLPGIWILRLEISNGQIATLEFKVEPGEKRDYMLLTDSEITEISLRELAQYSQAEAFEIRSQRRRGMVKNRGQRIGSILEGLAKFDAGGSVSYAGYSASQLESKVAQYAGASSSSGLVREEIVGLQARLSRYMSPKDDGQLLWSQLNGYINSRGQSDLPLESDPDALELWVSKSDREIAQVGLPGDAPPSQLRSWIHVTLNDHRLLLSVPPKWNSINRSRAIPYSVNLKTRNTPLPLARIYVHDPDMYDVMYAMTPTGIADADMIAAKAEEWLFSKRNNPVAATGGGFALLAHKLHGEDRERWFKWLDNLDDWNRWLPDAAILRGTLRLKGPKTVRDFDAARDHLKRAFVAGIPYYTLGVTWLQTGLGKLAGDDPELQTMFNEVSTLARRLDTSAVFTSLRL